MHALAGLKYGSQNKEGIKNILFKQYERIVIESLASSFGLDFLVKDQHGGDVDTIHTVRQLGKDKEMYYKNEVHKYNYDNKGEYNSHKYHSDDKYIERNRAVKSMKEHGELQDSYTGKKFGSRDKSDLDHVISAKEIHEDPARILAGRDGVSLANSQENLEPTNPSTNRSKKADSMKSFLERKGEEYTEEQHNKMHAIDNNARKSYEVKLAEYYRSSDFIKNVGSAALSVGVRIGLRQALGFIFAEIWFAFKEKWSSFSGKIDNLFHDIAHVIRNAYESVRIKCKALFDKFITGAIAGALSSIVTTICNVFLTTAKNTVKIIREIWVSLVQAFKILVFNPESLLFGEKIREASKILSIGASVLAGTMVSEAISKTPLGAIPELGGIITGFIGSFVTGIMSCTLLYVLDSNPTVQKLVEWLNTMPSIENIHARLKEQVHYLECYAAELMKIDLQTFKERISLYDKYALQLEYATTIQEQNEILKEFSNKIALPPYEGDFSTFMADKSKCLVFK